MFNIKSLIGIFFLSISVFSQDSILCWKSNFQFDNRISSIRNSSIILIGAKLGYQYKNLTRVGVGVSFVPKPVEFEYLNRRTSQHLTNKVDFWYFSVYNDWIVYKGHYLEIFVTEQVGFGKPRYIRELSPDVSSESNINLYVNEISTQIHYKINTIVGIGAGIGYRNVLNKKSLLTDSFEAPIYMIKIILYSKGIINMIRNKH